MRVTLTVLAGPNVGHVVAFDGHDTFVVGRSKRTSAALPHKDPYLSRYHFLLEINPPLCRVLDLESHNGTFVNGEKVPRADLVDGDILKAGHTAFRVGVVGSPALHDQNPTTVHSPPVMVGDIPGYKLVREIGYGGMGVVYEARRESDGRAVALKTIRPIATPTRAAVERFLREADILRQLDHPNVVRYLDGGEVGGTLWFAMEYVPGVDAGRWVKQTGPMSVADAVAVANAVLRGLEYAHGLGFVHRDVKPANLLLEPRDDGTFGVKLADFGLARVYDESRMSGLTLTGDIGGRRRSWPRSRSSTSATSGPRRTSTAPPRLSTTYSRGRSSSTCRRAWSPRTRWCLKGTLCRSAVAGLVFHRNSMRRYRRG